MTSLGALGVFDLDQGISANTPPGTNIGPGEEDAANGYGLLCREATTNVGVKDQVK